MCLKDLHLLIELVVDIVSKFILKHFISFFPFKFTLFSLLLGDLTVENVHSFFDTLFNTFRDAGDVFADRELFLQHFLFVYC